MENKKTKKGIESLKLAVIYDCKDGENCFNENGCNHEFTRIVPETNPVLIEMGIKTACKTVSKCFHQYCNKYKWIIDRAKYYAEKTGKTPDEIIEIWEGDRTYWYMNYYQEGNQPLKGIKKDDEIIFFRKKELVAIDQEIKTYNELVDTLEYDHQKSTKNDLIKKVENLEFQFRELKARLELYKIRCFD